MEQGRKERQTAIKLVRLSKIFYCCMFYILKSIKGHAVIINTFLKNYHRKGTSEHFVLFEAVIYMLYYNFIFGLHFRLFFHSFKVVIVHCNTLDKIEPQHICRLRRNLVGMCTFFQHS